MGKIFPNKITVYDAYKMLNSLCIPYNETKAFIASGSNFGNEFLNLEEFSNLIFTEDEKFNSGPYKILSLKKSFDVKEENDLTNKILLKNKDINDNNNILILKDFISKRIITLNKNMKIINKEKYSFLENEKNNKNNKNTDNVNKFK